MLHGKEMRSSENARLDLERLARLQDGLLHEAAARTDEVHLEFLDTRQAREKLLLGIEFREVLRGVAAVAVDDDEEIRTCRQSLESILAFLVRLRVVDGCACRRFTRAVPSFGGLIAELLDIIARSDEPDIGWLVVEFVPGGRKIPADAARRGIGSRRDLHAAL